MKISKFWSNPLLPDVLLMDTDFLSPSSSPPTPPSPLPISVGPGYQKYMFSSSPSPSPSPPFSPHSSHTSPENTPLLSRELPVKQTVPSPFSLDQITDESLMQRSCLQTCLEWLFLRCCCWSRIRLHPD